MAPHVRIRLFASVNRREPVRIWCEYASTRPLRPLYQSHTTSYEISACEYGANIRKLESGVSVPSTARSGFDLCGGGESAF